MSAPEEGCSPTMSGPRALKVQTNGRLIDGTYEVRGHVMVVQCGDRSASACIGLLDHRKLARALLIHLDAKGCCAPSPTPAQPECAATRDAP